jgi:hypothetical protein
MKATRHLLFRMWLLVLIIGISTVAAQAHNIEVCKHSDLTAPVPSDLTFNFTLDGSINFSLTPGQCTTYSDVGAGSHTITEGGQVGVVVSQITVTPPEALVSFNLAGRTVTVLALEGVTTIVTFVNKRQTGTQGCTPGFWKQNFHFGFWVGFSPAQTVSSVFPSATFANSLGSETLLTALQGGGGSDLTGAEQILLRAAVAALLNSTNLDISFAFTTSEIIAAVTAAVNTGDRGTILTLATDLDNANNGTGGCPL